jgi:peptidyl-prolyl cis-trans isomerase SurA
MVNNNKKIILIFIFIMMFSYKAFSNDEFYIIYNVKNTLITNIDVKKESRYLIALNNQLKNLGENDIFNISKESILRENIKKIELLKYFKLDSNKKNPLIESYIKNFYQRLKLANKVEFKEFLKNNDLSITFIENKILIEILWNKLIFDKYQNQVKINEEKLKNEIQSNKSTQREKVYNLSEIVFEKNNQDTFEAKINKINESIKEIGFKNSANIYSISDSAKFGGEIGWIEEKQLSNIILKSLNNLVVGQYSAPIKTGSSFIVLKINEIKFNEKIINLDEELKIKIQYEKNRQLQQFSKIYYNKIKINTDIDEL